MKISSTALKAKHSCASGYRWFARRFKSPAEYQSVIDALVADGRVDDACWLLEQFGPIKSVLVLDAISAHAFVHAGSVQVRGEVDVDAMLRTGGSLKAGGSIRAGNTIWIGNDLHAGAGLRTLGSLRTGGDLVSSWSVEVHGALTCGGDLRVRGALACGAAMRGEGSTVVAEDLEVNGMIHCEKSLQVGGHLVCTEGLRAGHGIQVGQSVRSGMHIDAGWGIVAGADITAEGAIRAGECIVSGGSVRPGAGFSLYAGLSARRDAWPSCGRVVSRARPENLLSGFWDRSVRSAGMMTQFGPILVATDFSAHARHATARAARLAHDTHSALTLMHVLPAQPITRIREWLGASSVREQKQCDEAHRQLHQLASEISSVRRVEFDIEAAAGSATDEIVRGAERVDAQLLVLGARGAGFLRRLVLGTTSQRLVRRTDRPLLVVRQTANRSYRRVLVAVDFSPQSRHALILARRVAPNAKLVILTVFEVPFEGKLRFAGIDDATVEIYRQRARERALRQLHALAHEASLSPAQWEPGVVEGNASRRIIEQEQSRNCDLVVLAPDGQSAAADLLLGSVTRHVLAEGHVDVLLSTRMPGQPIRPWE